MVRVKENIVLFVHFQKRPILLENLEELCEVPLAQTESAVTAITSEELDIEEFGYQAGFSKLSAVPSIEELKTFNNQPIEKIDVKIFLATQISVYSRMVPGKVGIAVQKMTPRGQELLQQYLGIAQVGIN